MSPCGGSAHSWAAVQLAVRLAEPVRAAGHAPYMALNVQLNPCTWTVPDLNWVFAIDVPFVVELDPADLLEP